MSQRAWGNIHKIETTIHRMLLIEPDADQRALARRIAGCGPHDSVPVVVVHGWQRPHVRGRSYYWTTPGGEPVYYPRAYQRAFGRPIYNHSTRRVVVGDRWLLAHSGHYAKARGIK